MKLKTQGTFKIVPIKELHPDPEQPRQDFDATDLKKLQFSIEDKGIMNPITVEPQKNGQYLIIDGERRYRCALELKIKEVPVNILEKELNPADRNIVRFQLQETHKSWTIFEKAEAMNRLKEILNLPVYELARALAIAPITCHRYLSILNLAPKIRKQITEVKMPFSYVEKLNTINSIMPSSISKQCPDYLEKCIDKYQKGTITTHKDFYLISRLIRTGEYNLVLKFFKDKKYTAMNAYMDSETQTDQIVETATNRAKLLIKDLQIIKKNNLKMDKINEAIFNQLCEELDTI